MSHAQTMPAGRSLLSRPDGLEREKRPYRPGQLGSWDVEGGSCLSVFAESTYMTYFVISMFKKERKDVCYTARQDQHDTCAGRKSGCCVCVCACLAWFMGVPEES